MPCSVVGPGWNIPEQRCSGKQLCLLSQTDHAPWAWSQPDAACSHISPAPYMQLLYSHIHCCMHCMYSELRWGCTALFMLAHPNQAKDDYISVAGVSLTGWELLCAILRQQAVPSC